MSYFSIRDLIVIAVGFLTLGIWLMYYRRGKRYEDLFLPLEDEDFPMKELYFIGYKASEDLKIRYKSEKNRQLRKQIAVLYGDKYVDFYLRAIYAQRITMALTIACLGLPVYGFTGGSLILFIAVYIGAGLAYYYYGTTLPEKITQRQNTMLEEFSELVSKLALLVNAGMILHDAWAKVAVSGDSQIYKEMQRSVEDMRNGVPETEAIYTFGQRSMMPEIKKFSSTLIQGLSRGVEELSSMLTLQSKEVWNTKQQLMRRKGELANNKLLLPILIVFIGILIMVVVPIFAGIGA